MCRCNPKVKKPFCGKDGCFKPLPEWPKQETVSEIAERTRVMAAATPMNRLFYERGLRDAGKACMTHNAVYTTEIGPYHAAIRVDWPIGTRVDTDEQLKQRLHNAVELALAPCWPEP